MGVFIVIQEVCADQMKHKFEDIEVKANAVELLESTQKKEKQVYDWNRCNV